MFATIDGLGADGLIADGLIGDGLIAGGFIFIDGILLLTRTNTVIGRFGPLLCFAHTARGDDTYIVGSMDLKMAGTRPHEI